MRHIDGNKKPAGKAGSLQNGFERDYNVAGRCHACLTPTLLPWHRYCRACLCWLRFARGLRMMRSASQALHT